MSWSCVCIYRLRPEDDGGYLMIKIVDDPFCPAHHAEEELPEGAPNG